MRTKNKYDLLFFILAGVGVKSINDTDWSRIFLSIKLKEKLKYRNIEMLIILVSVWSFLDLNGF
jgi:hypothetical protein